MTQSTETYVDLLLASIRSYVPLSTLDQEISPVSQKFYHQELLHAKKRLQRVILENRKKESSQKHANPENVSPILSPVQPSYQKPIRTKTINSLELKKIKLLEEQEREVKKQHLHDLRRAKVAISERKRTAARLAVRVQEMRHESQGFLLRRKWKEEQAMNEILKAAQKERIQYERELHQHRKQEKKEREEKAKLKRVAKMNYIEDQIKLLQEQLTQAKLEDSIAERAKVSEYRKLLTETKRSIKSDIRLMKDKLRVNEGFEEEQLDKKVLQLSAKIQARKMLKKNHPKEKRIN